MNLNIEKLNKEIAENEFKLKSSENRLIESLEGIKALAEVSYDQGIINEDQKTLLSNTTKEDLMNSKLDSFQKLSEVLKDISNQLDDKISTIENHIKSLESM